MSFSLGLRDFAQQIRELGEATKALDGPITTLKFNSSDAASVDNAIADMEEAIDLKVASYLGNQLVAEMVSNMKASYRTRILEQASDAQLSKEVDSMGSDNDYQAVLRQIENTIGDLRQTEMNSFDRHIKKLSRLLHSAEIVSFTESLTSDIDLDTWLRAGHATQGGMIGSAKLEWPTEPEKELGTAIKLIDMFAAEPNEAINFSHSFYHNGNNVSSNLRNMVSHVISPFGRDYINFIKTSSGAAEATMLPPRSGPAARKAFIVHGHDDGAREAVARFLERIGFEAIILHEQANKGLTVIEKIEAHGDVGFAVVLLTPDDVGGVKGNDLQPRARQNVLLELGYFIGRLGRSRVCALKRGEVEIPSDFGGVVYETFDNGNGWKSALGRELEAAGFEIDWNKVMRP